MQLVRMLACVHGEEFGACRGGRRACILNDCLQLGILSSSLLIGSSAIQFLVGHDPGGLDQKRTPLGLRPSCTMLRATLAYMLLACPLRSAYSLAPARCMRARPKRRDVTTMSADGDASDHVSDPTPSLAELTVQAAPFVTCLATGSPWFAAVYAPLLVVGRAAEANPAATLSFSTLLYASGSTLFNADPGALLSSCAANLACAAMLLYLQQVREARQTLPVEDPFADFDRRLNKD